MVFKWPINAEVHKLQTVCAVGWYVHDKNVVGVHIVLNPRGQLSLKMVRGLRPTATEVALVCGMFPQHKSMTTLLM